MARPTRPASSNVVTRRTFAVVSASAVTPILNRQAWVYGSDRRGDDEWHRWRGPTANNHAHPAAMAPPAIDDHRIAWSIQVVGRGHSSPIVVGDAIFLTTADEDPGTQSVLAFTRDGRWRWETVVHRGGLPAENHRKNTEASPTAAFDGRHLFVSFYNRDAIWLTSLTTAGEIRWQIAAGRYTPQRYQYGYAASPLIFGDTVIVVGDYDGEAFMAAFARETGEQVWRVARPGNTSFSSPIVGHTGGRDQLLLSGGDKVAAYDPADGRTLWTAPGATTMATCGTVVWDDQRVFASGGYPEAETVCVASDGSGRVIWSNATKCYEQSMLVVDDHLYAVADNGVAYCWRCDDGTERWKRRLGGAFSSSPVLAGDTIHVFNEAGQGFAFEANPERFVPWGLSQVGDEVFATPAVVGNTMYLRVARKSPRRQEYLIAAR